MHEGYPDRAEVPESYCKTMSARKCKCECPYGLELWLKLLLGDGANKGMETQKGTQSQDKLSMERQGELEGTIPMWTDRSFGKLETTPVLGFFQTLFKMTKNLRGHPQDITMAAPSYSFFFHNIVQTKSSLAQILIRSAILVFASMKRYEDCTWMQSSLACCSTPSPMLFSSSKSGLGNLLRNWAR